MFIKIYLINIPLNRYKLNSNTIMKNCSLFDIMFHYILAIILSFFISRFFELHFSIILAQYRSIRSLTIILPSLISASYFFNEPDVMHKRFLFDFRLCDASALGKCWSGMGIMGIWICY